MAQPAIRTTDAVHRSRASQSHYESRFTQKYSSTALKYSEVDLTPLIGRFKTRVLRGDCCQFLVRCSCPGVPRLWPGSAIFPERPPRRAARGFGSRPSVTEICASLIVQSLSIARALFAIARACLSIAGASTLVASLFVAIERPGLSIAPQSPAIATPGLPIARPRPVIAPCRVLIAPPRVLIALPDALIA